MRLLLILVKVWLSRNEEKDYDAFFQKAMKKFGISSPADLKTDEKKKEFFNYIDKKKASNEEDGG